jgi:hypothetical protein
VIAGHDGCWDLGDEPAGALRMLATFGATNVMGGWEENRTPDLRITRGSRSLSGSVWRRLGPPEQVLSNWPPRRPWSWPAHLWDGYGVSNLRDHVRSG